MLTVNANMEQNKPIIKVINNSMAYKNNNNNATMLLSFILLGCFVCGYANAFVFPSLRSTRVAKKPFSSELSEHPIDQNPYAYSKVKHKDYDAVVIGSGLGGLSTASLLAQNGKKVLVLEQHSTIGGACHTFERKGYRFAPGVHYVGNLEKGEPDNLRAILDCLTPKNDPVEWDKMPDHIETVTLGDPSSCYQIIVGGEERYKQNLIEMFPNEKEAINNFVKLMHKSKMAWKGGSLLKSLPLPLSRVLTWTGLYRLLDKGFHKMTRKTVKQVLEKLTQDKDLQAVLAAYFGDYGVEPERAPFLLQAAVPMHYMKGAYYPRGGPAMLPRKIIRNIVDHGGDVLSSAVVQSVLVDPNTKKVSGVEMKDGSTIQSNIVVSDVGIMNTATKLLPPKQIDIDFANDESAMNGKLHPSSTGVMLFVGLNEAPEKLNLPKCIHWIYPSNDLSGDLERIRNMDLEEALKLDPQDWPIFVSTTGCTTDTAWATSHPNRSIIEIITFTPWHWFEKFSHEFDRSTHSHGPEYEKAKNALADKVVDEVLEHNGAKLPKKITDVDFFEVGTPLSFEHYFNSQHGAFYGLDNDQNRFSPRNFFLRLRPEVHEIEGLYLTGQDTVCDGIDPVAISGLLCAAKILGRMNPFTLLDSGDAREETNTDKEIEETPRRTVTA